MGKGLFRAHPGQKEGFCEQVFAEAVIVYCQ